MYILGGRGRRFASLRVRDLSLSVALYIAELCVEDMAFSALFLAAETKKMMGTGGEADAAYTRRIWKLDGNRASGH